MVLFNPPHVDKKHSEGGWRAEELYTCLRVAASAKAGGTIKRLVTQFQLYCRRHSGILHVAIKHVKNRL